MPRDNTHRIYALAWLSILVAACGGTVVQSGDDGGAGSGGTGGSSSTGGTGGSEQDLIDTTCAAMNAASCPFPECENVLEGSMHEAAEEGCDDEFAALLVCGNANGWDCLGDEPNPPAACDIQLSALEDCGGAAQSCLVGYMDGECVMDCQGPTTWSVSCIEGASLECRCTMGPNQGFAFSLEGDCGSADWSSKVKSYCGS